MRRLAEDEFNRTFSRRWHMCHTDAIDAENMSLVHGNLQVQKRHDEHGSEEEEWSEG